MAEAKAAEKEETRNQKHWRLAFRGGKPRGRAAAASRSQSGPRKEKNREIPENG